MKKIILIALALMFVPLASANTYFPGEQALLLVSVHDWKGEPIENAECNTTVFYPNGSIYFHSALDYDPAIQLYKASFTIPNETGTYLELAKCKVLNGGQRILYDRSSFYVSENLYDVKKQIESLIQNATLNVTAQINITGNLTQAVLNATDEILGLLLALHSTPVTKQYCENNTLVIEKIATWTINNKTYNITKVEKVDCPFGCSNGECVNPLFSIGLLFGIIIFIGIVVYLVWRLS